MRVLFVLENYLPHVGGAEIVFKNLAEGLSEKGFHIDLVTHKLKHTKKFEIVNGVHVHRVRCFDSRYLFTFFSIPLVIALAKKADIVHTTTFNGAPPAWLGARLTGKKCILTIHEVWINRWRQLTDHGFASALIHNFLEKMIYILPFDLYACVSKNTQKDLVHLGVAPNKTAVVYNGIDYDHFDPGKYNPLEIRKRLGLGKTFVYMYYGRPGPSKGVEYLVKAVRQISRAIPQSMLLLILSKDPAYRKRYNTIRRLIKTLGVESNILLQDPVRWNELPAYISMADCVVVPSLAEGFGFSAVESCAMSKPLVATHTGSLPEVVSGKYVLVKPKSAEALAKGIITVYRGKVTQTPLKRFDKADNINGYLGLYNQILELP